MMRNGKGIGTLNWKTDKIYLLKSSKPELTHEDFKDMSNGKYIVRRVRA
jgi:hypothetical protein